MKKPPRKQSVPKGFTKTGVCIRDDQLKKIEDLALAYNADKYRMVEKLLDIALKGLKIPKPRDLEELG